MERLVSVDANSRRSGFLPPHQSPAVSAPSLPPQNAMNYTTLPAHKKPPPKIGRGQPPTNPPPPTTAAAHRSPPASDRGCFSCSTQGCGQAAWVISRGGAEDGGVLVEIVCRVGVRRGVLRRPEAVADGVVCVAVEVCAYGSGGEFRAAASDVLPVRRNSYRASSTSLFYVRCRNHCRSSTCFILRFGVHYSRFRHHIIRIT